LAGAIILHISFIVAAAIMVARISTPARWRTQRGDPTAEAGGSGADVPQPADNQDFDRSLTSPPPISSSRTAAHPPSISQESDDSSALPDPLVLLPPAPIDPMIGIRSSQSAQPVPRFASTQPLASISHDKARPGAAGGSTLATGTTTPPRVASSGGGQRGNRDGFDSRGLPIPDYPTESRRRGEEGMVVVDVEVLPNGSVGSIRVVSDAGHPRLGTAAVEKLKFAAFEPAREDGRAVVGHILIPYRFTLD
jgi:protein TonB